MTQTPADWGSPEPLTPDRDVPPIDGCEAAAALAVAASAEDEQKQAVRAPRWFYVSIGACLAVLVAANAISTEAVRIPLLFGVVAVEGLVIGLMVGRWRRQGVWPQMAWSVPGAAPGAVATMVVALVVLAPGGFLLAVARPEWALVLGVVVFVGYVAVTWAADAWFARHSGTASR
ncbi:MAG: hypothetical protein FWD11_05095 [Micrococcales bacterium]|nr:hypothetical protein [Micrococcales bacterium]